LIPVVLKCTGTVPVSFYVAGPPQLTKVLKGRQANLFGLHDTDFIC